MRPPNWIPAARRAPDRRPVVSGNVTAPGEQRFQVPAAAAGRRLDQFLAEVLDQSRNRIQRRIAAGDVRLDGQIVNSSQRLTEGARIEIAEEARPAATHLEAEPLDPAVEILDECPDFVILVKPPGMVVHPGAGHDSGTLAHQLLSRFPEISQVGHPQRPGIVHRLDVGTSGVMVVARSERGYQELTKAFSSRRVRKRYLAIVYGERIDELDIDLPIGRHPRDRKRMAVRSGGRPALSRVRSLASGNGLSLVEIELHTGRTHQIRVHLKAAKHPLLGDPTYGEARWKAFPTRDQPGLRDFGRPALHAWKLAFTDPFAQNGQGRRRRYAADVPTDMRDLWRRLVGDWPV